jgi:hypothetical protein
MDSDKRSKIEVLLRMLLAAQTEVHRIISPPHEYEHQQDGRHTPTPHSRASFTVSLLQRELAGMKLTSISQQNTRIA